MKALRFERIRRQSARSVYYTTWTALMICCFMFLIKTFRKMMRFWLDNLFANVFHWTVRNSLLVKRFELLSLVSRCQLEELRISKLSKWGIILLKSIKACQTIKHEIYQLFKLRKIRKSQGSKAASAEELSSREQRAENFQETFIRYKNTIHIYIG